MSREFGMNGVLMWWTPHMVVMAHYWQLVPFIILVDDHTMLKSDICFNMLRCKRLKRSKLSSLNNNYNYFLLKPCTLRINQSLIYA